MAMALGRGSQIGRGSARAITKAAVLCGLLAAGAAAYADRAPPSRAVYKLEGNRLASAGTVEFQTGSDKLKPSPETEATLGHVRDFLADKAYISLLRIEVHSDNQGDAAKNQALTEQRAVAVARALITKGVDCKRLLAVGFGASKPVADSATPEGRAQNRRVSFFNAAMRGHLIGGMPADGGGKVAIPDLCAAP